MTRPSLPLLCFLAVILAACSGGGSNPGGGANGSIGPGSMSTSSFGSCAFITGGSTKTSTSTDLGCTNCSTSNASQAADGDLSSFATISVNQAAPTTGEALRVTAQPGVIFPKGNRAGVVMTLPGSSGGSGATVQLRTYMAGALQESADLEKSGSVASVCLVCGTGGSEQFYSFQSSKQFDAVEVWVGDINSASAVPAKVNEFCSNSNGSH